MDGKITPAAETNAPCTPRTRYPTIKQQFTLITPGKDWDTATISMISLSSM
jgi:hypothetical protein